MREIRLYGELGRRFGRVHRLAVESVGEALRALMANHRDFERTFLEVAPGYKVWSGTTRLADAEEVHNPSGEREIIRIAPALAGAGKGGIGSILLGAALIGAAIFMPASIGAIGLFGSATVASVVGSIGVSLVLGGVAQMLSPTRDTDPGSQDKNQPSYVFNGAVNTSAQGHPVPVGYGRLIVGSAVISAGLSAEEMDIDGRTELEKIVDAALGIFSGKS